MPRQMTALALFSFLVLLAPNVANASDGDIFTPRCQEQSVLNWISSNFAWAERNQWQRGFVIDEIMSPQLRYQVNFGPTTIPHDHCQAEALMTDGRVWRVYYTVERGVGFASIGDKIRYCIIGLDPWHVYGAACSTVR